MRSTNCAIFSDLEWPLGGHRDFKFGVWIKNLGEIPSGSPPTGWGRQILVG